MPLSITSNKTGVYLPFRDNLNFKTYCFQVKRHLDKHDENHIIFMSYENRLLDNYANMQHIIPFFFLIINYYITVLCIVPLPCVKVLIEILLFEPAYQNLGA